MGVGSEVYGALRLGRRGIGIELKPSYYRQAKSNIAEALKTRIENQSLFESLETSDHELEQAG
jgi:DNA modification methylase